MCYTAPHRTTRTFFLRAELAFPPVEHFHGHEALVAVVLEVPPARGGAAEALRRDAIGRRPLAAAAGGGDNGAAGVGCRCQGEGAVAESEEKHESAQGKGIGGSREARKRWRASITM